MSITQGSVIKWILSIYRAGISDVIKITFGFQMESAGCHHRYPLPGWNCTGGDQVRIHSDQSDDCPRHASYEDRSRWADFYAVQGYLGMLYIHNLRPRIFILFKEWCFYLRLMTTASQVTNDITSHNTTSNYIINHGMTSLAMTSEVMTTQVITFLAMTSQVYDDITITYML